MNINSKSYANCKSSWALPQNLQYGGPQEVNTAKMTDDFTIISQRNIKYFINLQLSSVITTCHNEVVLQQALSAMR